MSINRTDALQISRRYATAIFALAAEAKKTAEVTKEFSVLAAAIIADAPLADILANPTIANENKAGILSALMKKADALTLRALDVVVAGGRCDLIPTIAQQLHDMHVAEQGEVEATITSARALSAATQKQLAASLALATGKKVQLKLENDPAVLGGVRIELGSLRLDATLAGALSNMRAQLLATTA